MIIISSIIALLVGSAHAALMAIDLGSEFLKVSLVRPGRTPVSIVINEISKRKTPALVAIVDGERLIGEDANALVARFPDKIFARARDFLGRRFDDPYVRQMMGERFVDYTVVADGARETVAFKADDGLVYSAEEIVASLLYYAKEITREANDKTYVLDSVITVPVFFSHFQRQALLDAAALAGLNVLGLVNSHAGTALQFGIERSFDNATQRAVFFDLGANSLEASLVEFSSFQGKEFGRTKSIGQFVVKDVTYDASLGAESLESVLADHFALEFNDKVLKQKGDVRAQGRAMAKLRKQCKKTKEVLSANSESYFGVEELYQEHDFKSSIKREAFEAMVEERMGLSDRVKQPVLDLLERNGLGVKDLDYFELVGGGSRVPMVQRALQEVLGERPLDRHLDADEATVLGAGLIAANMSTSFRLRQFGMVDGMPFQILLTRGDLPAPNNTVTVLPRMKRLPQARKVTLSIPLGPQGPADALDFTLAYDEAVDLPPAVSDAVIGRFQLSGLADVYRRYNTTGKVALHINFLNGGMVVPERAEATIEVTEMVEVEEKVPLDPKEIEALAKEQAAEDAARRAKEESEAAAAEGDASSAVNEEAAPEVEAPVEAPAAANATASAANVTATFKVVKVTKPKKMTYRVNLPIGGAGYAVAGMSTERFNAARSNLNRLVEAERVKAEDARAKNDLESFVISGMEALQEDAEVQAVSTEKERQALLKQMTEAEDWLYGDGEHAKAAESQKKLAGIRGPYDRIALRAREMRERPLALADARKAIEAVVAGARGWAESKPWIAKGEADKIEKEAGSVTSWLDKMEKAQAKKKPTDDPAFLVGEVRDKVAGLELKFKLVDMTRKPKEEKKKDAKDDSKGKAQEGEGANKGPEGAESDGQSTAEDQKDEL